MVRDRAVRSGRDVREPVRQEPLARRRLFLAGPADDGARQQAVEPEPGGSLRLEVRVVGGDPDGDVAGSSANGQNPLLLRVEEAARMLAISRGALYPLLGRDIPIVRIGRSVRIQSEALRQFIADHVDRS